jgi:DNA-directed RNA polymerase specialized sigma24 family protein
MKVSREQTRFVEDINRFDNLPPKKQYNQKIHQMQPPQGPSSASPGPWVPETITNCWMESNRQPEKLALMPQLPEYKNAVAVRNSYRQFVFGPGLPPPIDDSPNFSMVEQSNVLAGRRWLDSPVRAKSLYKLTQHAEELESDEESDYEGSLYQLNDDGEVEDADDHEEPVEADFSEDEENEVQDVKSSPSPVCVSDEEMDAVYRAWFSEPRDGDRDGKRQALWETGHNFFSQKASQIWAGNDMRKQGKLDDFQMEFEFKLMRILRVLDRREDRGTVINQPSHYLTRSWNNCRKTALTKLTKENRKHPNISELRSTEGDRLDDDAPTLVDFAEAQRWQNGDNSEKNAIEDQEAADEALLQQREGKLATLDADLADVVGMRLAGLRQREIAQRMNISQQAVSKKLIKAKSSLQEVN